MLLPFAAVPVLRIVCEVIYIFITANSFGPTSLDQDHNFFASVIMFSFWNREFNFNMVTLAYLAALRAF